MARACTAIHISDNCAEANEEHKCATEDLLLRTLSEIVVKADGDAGERGRHGAAPPRDHLQAVDSRIR